MGQFKPMVKMETTEPSVILKLKKGGHVAMPGKAAKKMDGGAMGAMAAAPRVPAVAPAGRAPARPSLAERRRAMMAAKAMAAPAMAKKGGKMESKAEHAKEATKAELEAHADKPASKAHKGLKTGGVVKGQGGYKTGGVVKGQGGYKKGGAVKKFADGGRIDSGRAVSMPQGSIKPSQPVSTNRQAGTFKHGGKVRMASGGSTSDKEMDMSKGAYDAHYAREKADNEADRKAMTDVMMFLPRQAKKAFNSLTGQGSVTEREKSITVTPASKKSGGRAC